jgi:hypothetical protein
MRRRRIYGMDRHPPGSDLPTAEPHVVQQGEGLSSSARGHLRTLHSQDLSRPAGSGGGIVFVLLLAIAALIVITALAATGNL